MRYVILWLFMWVTSLCAMEFFDAPILTEKRLDLTRKYVKRHYGVDSYHLVRPKMIVLHYTSVGTVANSIMMMKNDEVSPSRMKTRPFGKVNTGAHFLVSAKGDIYSLIPTTVIARHIVGFEHVSISIENVATEWTALTQAQMDANIYLIRMLLARHPSINYLIGHHEYMMKRRDHFRFYKELDPDVEAPIKIDPGFAFMTRVRRLLSERHGITLLK